MKFLKILNLSKNNFGFLKEKTYLDKDKKLKTIVISAVDIFVEILKSNNFYILERSKLMLNKA